MTMDLFSCLAVTLMREPCGAYFAALSKRLNKHLLHQHHIEIEQWQTALEIDFDRVVLQYHIRPLQGRADDIGKIRGSSLRFERSGFEPRHIEKIADKAVEPLGLLLNRAHEARSHCRIELLAMRDEAACRAEN